MRGRGGTRLIDRTERPADLEAFLRRDARRRSPYVHPPDVEATYSYSGVGPWRAQRIPDLTEAPTTP